MLILKCMHSWSYKHFFLLQCNENPHMYLTSPTSPTAGTPVAVASQEKSWTWKLWQGRPLSSQSIVIQLFWCSCWHFENISCIICVFAKTKYCIFLLKKSICKLFQSNTNDLLHLIWTYFLITCSKEAQWETCSLTKWILKCFFQKQRRRLYLEWVDFDASFSVSSLYSWEVNNSFLYSSEDCGVEISNEGYNDIMKYSSSLCSFLCWMGNLHLKGVTLSVLIFAGINFGGFGGFGKILVVFTGHQLLKSSSLVYVDKD